MENESTGRRGYSRIGRTEPCRPSRRSITLSLPAAVAGLLFLIIASALGRTDKEPAAGPFCGAQISQKKIARLKSLNLETSLCADGLPRTAIVIPGAARYEKIAAEINARVRELAGVDLPVIAAGARDLPEDLFRKSHVIALGNMTNNPLIRKLYFQWFCFTDGWYPGEGGCEVRTIHNPYGTGRNVILLGGSNEAGVGLAVKKFCSLLAPMTGRNLSVGRLMDIRLGENLEPPSDRSKAPPLLRLFSDGSEMPLGYNEASRAGLMYYYSGEKRHADAFIQTARRTGIIRGSDHYHAHHDALVWDLIEESPVFTDDDRLFVSNQLLEHARSGESAGGLDAFSNGQGLLFDRHAALIALCALCDCRYFARDYPAPEWSKALSAVDDYFRPFLPSFASGSDLARGIYTYLEALLIYSLLTDNDDIVKSGSLRAWAERCVAMCDPLGFLVPSGQYDEASYPYFTLRKAAYLLNDPGLLYAAEMRRRAAESQNVYQLGMEFEQGQAFHDARLEPAPPQNLAGVHVVPLDDRERRAFDAALPPEKAFSKITFRSGFGPDDQFLLLDGIWGGPLGKPIQDANAILQLTDGARTAIVNIDPETKNRRSSAVNHNVLSVTMNGEAAEPPRLASLEAAADLPSFGMTRTRLDPYMDGAWDRYIFWRKGSYFFVRDVFRAAREGVFSLESQWRVLGECRIDNGDVTNVPGGEGRSESEGSGLVIKIAGHTDKKGGRSGWPVRKDLIDFAGESVSRQYAGYARPVIRRLRPTAVVRLGDGETGEIAALIYTTSAEKPRRHSALNLGDQVFAVGGEEPAWIGFPDPGGEFKRGPLAVRAAFVWATADTIGAQGLIRLDFGERTVVAADRPVDLEWDTDQKTCVLKLGESTSLKIVSHGRLKLDPGEHRLTGMMPVETGTRTQLSDFLHRDAKIHAAVLPADDALRPALSAPRLPEVREPASGAGIHDLKIHKHGDEAVVLAGAEDGRVLRLDARGRILWEFQTKGPVHAVTLADGLPGARMVLAGSDDEHVRALDLSSGRLLWSRRAEVFPDASGYPWWTLDGKAKVRSILAADFDGDRRPDIAIGTGGMQVEMLGADGSLRWRRPVHYGLPVRLFSLPSSGGGPARLFAGMDFLASQANLFRFGPDGTLESADAFPSGREGWDYTGISALAVLEREQGSSVLAVCRTGAFNDVSFYEIETGRIVGKAVVGDSISGMVSLMANGEPATVIATEAGWVLAYRPDGRSIWSLPLPDSVVRLWTSVKGEIVAFCRNGDYFIIDATGIFRARGRASWPAAMLATSN